MDKNIFCVDIGGSKLICGAVTKSGKIIDTIRTEYPHGYTTDTIIQLISDGFRQLKHHNFCGCGVAVPGLCDYKKGLWLYSPFSHLSDIPIVKIVNGITQLPTVADNDVNVSALAEKHFGFCKDIGDFLWITVSNGIGGGLYLNGHLYRGQGLSAGEIGHFIVEENGRKCGCGNTGCLEAYASGASIAAIYRDKTNSNISAEQIADLDKIGYNGLCAPGVNLHRNVRCGRNFEYFSEDPYLSAQIAIAVINGVQYNTDGTPTKRYAVLKHLACNNSEDMRVTGDSILSERTLRELYLRTFEYVLAETEPLAIMAAYNKINGTFAAANSDLLDGVCRYEWGYKGWIMTDWDVRVSESECLAAGCDTCMPGKYVSFKQLISGGLDRATAQRRAANLIAHLARTRHYLNCKTQNT